MVIISTIEDGVGNYYECRKTLWIEQYATQILNRYNNIEHLVNFALKLITQILLNVIYAGFVMTRNIYLLDILSFNLIVLIFSWEPSLVVFISNG